MLINSIPNINFKGIASKVSNPMKPLMMLSCDTFEKVTPSNFTYSNQKKLDENKFDATSSEILMRSTLDLDKVIELSKSILSEYTKKVEFKNNAYDSKNYYVMKTTGVDGDKALLLDKDLKPLAEETTTVTSVREPLKTGNVTGRIIKTITGKDYRNNTEFNAEYLQELHTGRMIPIKEIKTKKDAQNRLIRKEIAELSDVEGIYNVKYEFPNGKSRVLSSAKIDKKTGNTVILKNMRSADMTRTQYRYEDDPNGNRIMEYKITSPDGKILMNQSQTFEKISDNKFVSSRNNKIYDIEISNLNLKITDRKTQEQKEISLNTIYGKKEKVINVLKTIPGDKLMQAADRVKDFEGIEKSLESQCRTAPDMFDDEKLTKSRLTVGDNTFIFLHELGHAIDAANRKIKYDNENSFTSDYKILDQLCEEKEFVKIYNQEKENFLKEFPEAQRDYINYFIAEEAVEGQKNRGRKETIAETNGILNSYQSSTELGIRTQYLQQHFPKTIAYLSTKLTQA